MEPLDGVADSDEERYLVAIESPPDGDTDMRQTIKVRVTDTSGNLGGESWTLDVD